MRIWITLHLYVSILFMDLILLEANSCDLNINGCSYNVRLLPKDKHCLQENPLLMSKASESEILSSKRSKREAEQAEESGIKPVTREDFRALSKKVLKTLEKLSSRVLRWWRKLDRKVNLLAQNSNSVKSQSFSLNHRCPDGFTSIENWPSCYLLSHFNTSWYEAKDYCSAFESDLVAMGTVREHFLLTFLIKNNPLISEAKGWWTSGSFLGNTRQWMWTSQFFTKPFTFIKWAEGEPNEKGSQCMLLKYEDNHLWNDAICTEKFNFICEVQVKVV